MRSNAYNAAKMSDPTADVTTLYTIATDYMHLVQPHVNRALTTQQIAHDPQFLVTVARVKNAAKAGSGSGGEVVGAIEGVILLAGLAVGGWYLYKHYGKKWLHKKSKKHRHKGGHKSSFISSLSSTSAPKVGA